jgi:hypothetical protein
MDKWRFSGSRSSFGKGKLFMYGGVVFKCLSCFGMGVAVLISLGLSIKIDEFMEIPDVHNWMCDMSANACHGLPQFLTECFQCLRGSELRFGFNINSLNEHCSVLHNLAMNSQQKCE